MLTDTISFYSISSIKKTSVTSRMYISKRTWCYNLYNVNEYIVCSLHQKSLQEILMCVVDNVCCCTVCQSIVKIVSSLVTMLIISLILKQRFFSLFFLIFSLLKALFTESAADLDKEHVSPLWLSVFKSVHHFSFPFLINGSNSCSFYSWCSFNFHLCYCLLLLSDLLMHCYHHFSCISNQLLN